ncbi:hypothetical protein HN827_01020 [archaeon]|jgi:hypothetical protein|nr:hypothetical protein [archaeon]MBT6821718.1 hypothetical protein [archaeon]MBT7391381.1 hypothetical protein [archaeon]
MFIKLLFKKFKFKENRFFEALIYGIIYLLTTYLIFLFYGIIIKKIEFLKYFYISLGIGFVMGIVYLIKIEVFKFLK